jgi:2-phosphosulfolactate phosphatase
VRENDSPHDQSPYQVRLDWGLDGLARLAPADIVVVVDVLGAGADVAALEATASASGADVARGGINNAAAVARWVLSRQTERGERTSVSVIAAGEPGPDARGVRFAVEDQLGAGAVVAALGDLGIDHCSPDAAVAGEGFRALRGALRHLLTASGTGRQWNAAGRRDEVLAAAALDASSRVPVLRDGVFVVD